MKGDKHKIPKDQGMKADEKPKCVHKRNEGDKGKCVHKHNEDDKAKCVHKRNEGDQAKCPHNIHDHPRDTAEDAHEPDSSLDQRTLVVFGDSLSDSGNDQFLEGKGPAEFLAANPQTHCGAFTNGLVWPQQLALQLAHKYQLGFPAAAGCPLASDGCEQRKSRKTKPCCNAFSEPTVLNYAVAGAVISPDTATFANAAKPNSVFPYQLLSAQVSTFVSQYPKFACAAKRANRSPCFDVIFFVGANDFLDHVLPILFLGLSPPPTPPITPLPPPNGYILYLISQGTPPPYVPQVSQLITQSAQWLPSGIITSMQSNMAAIANVLNAQRCSCRLKGKAKCRCSKDRSKQSIKFLVANVPDITAVLGFTQSLVPAFQQAGYPLPEQAQEFVLNMLTAYSTLLFNNAINPFNVAQGSCGTYARLLDMLAITQNINSNEPFYGISTPSSQPIWTGTLPNVTFNPNWAANPCGDGAATNDPIHPSKEVHFAFSKYIHRLLTLDTRIPRCPPPPPCLAEKK